MTYDAIILGLGAMGSSAAFHLARRSKRVLGLDQFDIPHSRGSSHGHSRAIRLCYYEHPDYVPLLRRAYELWRELEQLSGRELLRITGGLYMGRDPAPSPSAPAEGVAESSRSGEVSLRTMRAELVPGSRRSAELHNLPHEILTRAQLADRYPQFHLPDDYSALYEPEAGVLLPELVIAAHADQALRHGAELHGHEPVLDWKSDGSTVTVRSKQAEYRGKALIISAGAWAGQILRDLDIPIRATRQVLGWVWPKRPELFEQGRLPIWALEPPDGAAAGEYYGFPMMPESPGFKLALHLPGPEITPGSLGASALAPIPEDENSFRAALRNYIPDADGPLLAMRTCMYEMSPDSHFIIDRHPAHPNVSIAAGFSGHGFKFASVVGEVLADLAIDGATRHPIGFLGLSRFARVER